MTYNAESVTPRDLLFTTIVEISELVEIAGLEPSTNVPTLSLVVWRERLKKALNDGPDAGHAIGWDGRCDTCDEDPTAAQIDG